MSESHAVVWLDHVQARIITFSDGRGREFKARSRMSPSRAHSDADSQGPVMSVTTSSSTTRSYVSPATCRRC